MSIWFKKFRSSSSPQLRLFCFPYAGGSAAVFDGWERLLPDGIDVFAIQAPGRANRFAEPAIGVLIQKVAALLGEIEPYVDVPYMFVGHSNGALTAFALARALQLEGNANLAHLVISAKRAPSVPRTTPLLHRLPDDDFVEELRGLSATPDEILNSREVLQLFLPMLRADFALSEGEEIAPQPRLISRCTLFRGVEDRISREDMLAWRDFIDGPVLLRQFDGAHFFINHQRDAFVSAVREIIMHELAPQVARGRILRNPGLSLC